MTKAKQSNDYFTLSFKLMLIVALVVLVLAVVNSFTAGMIADRQAAAGRQARQALIPQAKEFEKIDAALTEEEAKTVSDIYLAKDGDTHFGYCVDVAPSGFGGGIEMIVAFSLDNKIYGIQIISHSETPGIGAKVLAEDGGLLTQYNDISTTSLGSVSAVSGATVTSNAVHSGVSAATQIVERLIQEGGNK